MRRDWTVDRGAPHVTRKEPLLHTFPGTSGAGLFIIPGIGPILAAGPIVAVIVSALEGAVVVGALSALGAGLVGLGVPHDSVLQYETALKAGKFLVLAHGSRQEAQHAKDILMNDGLAAPTMHLPAQAGS